MEHVTARFCPDIPGVSAFPELNVRVYVEVGGVGGVYFFSLDATQALAIWGARTFFRLNYLKAQMAVEHEGPAAGDAVRYRAVRVDDRGHAASFQARYGPTGPAFTSTPGSLEHFLTERYCLYVVDGNGKARRGHIQHAPWPLQPGFCDIDEDSMVPPGLVRAGPPLVHVARRIDVVAWGLEDAGSAW